MSSQMCLQMSLQMIANICKCHQILSSVSKYPVIFFFKCLCKCHQISLQMSTVTAISAISVIFSINAWKSQNFSCFCLYRYKYIIFFRKMFCCRYIKLIWHIVQRNSVYWSSTVCWRDEEVKEAKAHWLQSK